MSCFVCVEILVDINALVFRFLYHHNHVREGIVGQLHHEVDVLVLLFGKVLIRLAFPVDGACELGICSASSVFTDTSFLTVIVLVPSITALNM